MINNENPQPALPYNRAEIVGGNDVCGRAEDVQFSGSDGGYRCGCKLLERGSRGAGIDGFARDKRGADRIEQCGGEICTDRFYDFDEQCGGYGSIDLLIG